jgi:omega-6 fatty acid desaturase / acyl-lipid omega-6 desaturase (Delta-12 desaturase)
MYILMDVAIIASLVIGFRAADPYVSPKYITLPHPALYRVAKFALWALYGFMTGLPATGLWVVAHECGHQAFSPSKTINNSVGWVLHSA